MAASPVTTGWQARQTFPLVSCILIFELEAKIHGPTAIID
jgi:hypothetical protein